MIRLALLSERFRDVPRQSAIQIHVTLLHAITKMKMNSAISCYDAAAGENMQNDVVWTL